METVNYSYNKFYDTGPQIKVNNKSLKGFTEICFMLKLQKIKIFLSKSFTSNTQRYLDLNPTP